MSGEVRNWLPGEPGKYVTILDLKERWMKQQEEKKRAEKEREEREAREKVGERFNELKSDWDKERVEAKRVAGDRRKSGGRWLGKDRGRIESSGSKVEPVVEDVRYGDVDFGAGETAKTRDVMKVGETKTSGGKQVDGLTHRIHDRRHGSRRERTGFRGDDLPRVSMLEKVEVGEVNVLLESQSGDLKYKKKELRLDDVKISGDVQVMNHNREYDGLGRKSRGNGWGVKAMTSKLTEKFNAVHEKNGVEQIEEVRSKGGEQVTKMNCPHHSRSEHEGSGGFWVCKFIDPLSVAEKGESTMNKDNEKMINGNNTCLNNDVKLQSQTVEPSVGIEEHSKSSAATETASNRSGKFRGRGPYNGRKMYSDSRFEAPRNFCSLTTKHSNVGHNILKGVDFGSDGFDDKSKATKVTEWETTSGTISKARGNVIVGRETHQNSRFSSERNFSNRNRIPKTFNGWMHNDRLEKSGLMWVKKGEASVDGVRGDDQRNRVSI